MGETASPIWLEELRSPGGTSMNAPARSAEDLEQALDVHALDQESFRNLVRHVLADTGFSQAHAARQAGVSQSAFNQWLKGRYKGDNGRIERKLLKWLRSRDRASTLRALVPDQPSWVETPTAKKITTALSYAQSMGDIAVVYGCAGAGKTSTFHNYQATSPNVWIATMAPSSAALGPCLRRIAETVGMQRPVLSVARCSDAIRAQVMGTGGILIVDEAQHLQVRSLEEIRSIHDETGIGLCIAGNELVYTRVAGQDRDPAFAQIFSRIGMRQRLTLPDGGDVKALAHAWGVRGAEELKLLRDVSHKPGALRNVAKTLRLAAVVAKGNGGEITRDHLARAWQNLAAQRP